VGSTLDGGDLDGKKSLQIGQGFIGTGGDDELGQERNLGGALPVAEGAKRVCSQKEKELGVFRLGFAQLNQRVEGVIRSGLVGFWGIEQGQRETGFACNGELDHGGALGEAGGGAGGFERLKSHRGEEDLVERESLTGRAGNGQMAKMGRVEAASEEGYAHWDMVADGSVTVPRGFGEPDLRGLRYGRVGLVLYEAELRG